MFAAVIRALGRLVGSRDDAAPRAMRLADPAPARPVARRAGAAMLVAVAALAPVAAAAQSAGCFRVNSGSLNYNAVFGNDSNGNPGNLNSTNARFSTTVSDQAYNAIRITASSDTLGNTAQYDSGNYAFAVGDRLTVTVNYSNFTNGDAIVRFRNGINATQAADVTGQDVVLGAASGSGTTTRSYTVTGSETSIGVRAFKAPTGNVTPVGSLSLTVACVAAAAAPTVTSVSPNAGPATGGTVVTITGTSFTGATAVEFDGVAATNVIVDSATQIRATTPAGSPGLATVVVTTPGGSGSLTSAYTYVAAPAVTQIAPTSGPGSGGTSVTVTGVNFTGATAVIFGATPATSFVVRSATEIAAVAPAGTGTVNIRVNTPGGTSATAAANAFTYIAAPVVNALAPASGPAGGGNTVVITGTGFGGGNNGATTTVAFGGTPATSATVNSNTQITAVAPAGTGVVNVTVTTVGGTSATAAGNQYTYLAPPTVSAIAPTGGSSGGGTPVTITGTNFVSGNTYTATFGATAVAATYASATTLTAIAPAGAGTVTVTVRNTTTAQDATGSASYTYAAPTVTALSVSSGPAGQARAVTITGTNFTPTATVTIGSAAASGVTYVSATQLTATLPGRPAGTYSVLVTTGGVTSAANPPADQYTYVAAPTVTAVTPNSGSTAGGTTVTITGANLAGATAVTFGGNAATNVVIAADGQSLTATTPAGAAGATTVAVTTQGGTGQLAGGYTYVVLTAPTVTTQPQSQTIAVGATATFSVTVSGSPSPAVQWQVSSDSGASFANIAGATGLSYTTPATTAGDNGNQYRAIVTNSQGSATSAPATLTVVQAPTANAQAATVAYQTARAITLTGTDPNTPARTLTYTVATQPQHGTLSGTAPNLTYTPAAGYFGPDSFTFTVSNGVSTSAPATVSLTVQQPLPVVNAISPAQGPVAGGTPVTIVGSGFTGVDPATGVRIGGTLATNVTINSNTQITATTPAGAIGLASVTVTNSTGTNAANTLFRYVGAPTADDQSVSTGFNTARAITLTGSDPNTPARTLTYTVATQPQFGTLSGAAPNLTYTPNAIYVGPDSFTFTVSNGVSTSAPGTISIDVDAPPAPAAPVVTAPANGSVTNNTTPTITGTTTAGSTVNVFIDGTLSGPAIVAGTSFSYTPTTALSESAHTVYAVASNIGGPSPQSATNTFTVDSVAPAAPSIMAPANGATVSVRRPAVTGNAETGSIVSVTINGAFAGTTTATVGSYSYALTADLPVGSNTVSVFATDAAGNQSPITTSIFTVVAQPAVSGVSPTQGPTAGGTTITITGTNLIGVTAVTVGGNAATNVVVVDATTVTATTPAGTAGPAIVAVSNQAGTSTTNGSFTYVAPPVANAQSVTTAFNTAAAITLTASNNATSYTVVTQPSRGTLSGAAPNLTYTPTAGTRGTDSFTFTATNAVGTSAPATVTITVGDPTITVSGTPPSGQRGAAYAAQLTASGGTAPYSFSVASGALPPGLTIGASGAISGTPTASGSFQVAFTVADSSDPAASVTTPTYTIAIAGPTASLSPLAGGLPGGTVGVAYSLTFSTSGATAPYSYAATGTLPPGLTLSSDGRVSGTPTGSGSFSFTVTSTDSSTAGSGGPYTASAAYTLTIAAPTITVQPATLPGATGGQAYSQQLGATGGTGPYTFATTGPLPAGVTLSSTGLVSGTPTQAGNFTFTVVATDSSTGGPGAGGAYSGSRSYTLAVAAPTITVNPATIPGATAGQAYAQDLTATGGSGTYTFTRSAGALPPGITLSAGGRLSGTPTAGGNFVFTVTATDAGGFTGARGYVLAVAPATIAIAPATLPDGVRGASYSQALTATGGTAPYAFSITAGALPAGLTLAADGTIAGQPAAIGSFTFTVTARDSSTGNGPFAGSRSYTLTITAAAITLAPATLPAATARVAYTQALTAAGGTAPYRYAVTAGALPAGITLATDGTLSGSATSVGSFTFTATATDAFGNAGSRGYTLVVGAPTITLAPATVPAATTRVAYSQAITATGGTAPYTYAVTAGALPGGITLSSSGTLAGSATAAGSFTFTVTATDANGNAGSRGYTLDVAAPAISIAPATLPAATTRVAYSQAITASGGVAPYNYAVTVGTLPTGLTLSTGGVLSGSTATAGSFDFTVTTTDANGNGAARAYTLVVTAPTIALAPATLPDATTRVAYSQAITATGGTAPYTYAVTAGALPAGLTLSSTGTLSGSATAAGSFTFTVTATDANGNAGAQGYTLAVQSPAIALAPASLADGTVGAAYAGRITATGGSGGFNYAVTAGALPAGITLATDGALSGTPSAGGSFAFTVTATDADGNTGNRAYTLAVAAPTVLLAPETLPAATRNVAYRQSLSANGGIAPYRYAVTAGALPAGVTLAVDGTLAGTVTVAGSYNFTVTATDSATGTGPYAGTRAYTLVVAAPTIVLAPATLPGATTRVAYSQAITASGGAGSYTYAVTAGALPGGITLSSDGTLSGAATAAGSFTFTVTATDANGNAGSRGYTLDVAAPAISIAPATLPAATTRVAYSQAITASGGVAPYNYAVTAGTLPSGLTLSTGGVLSGSTATAGSYDFTVTATDANGNGAARAYTLLVAAPTIALAPATLPDATTRVAYSQAITATGGTAPYTYAVTAGALPAGLTLSSTGTLAGSATAAGSFTFTVTATDTNGNAGAQSYTLAVQSPAIALAPANLADGTVGAAYAGRITATGGSGGFNYAVTAGALPAGITLATDGALSGTPSAGGSFAFTVTATDADGNTGNRAYTLAVAAPTIALAPETLPGATRNVAYRQSLSASGGVAPYRYAVTAGALPAGVTLAIDGTLAGTPTASGSFGFTVTATDSATGTGPYAGARAYTLVVAAPTIALSPTTLPGGAFNAAYAADLTATGGAAPYGFAVTAGALPGGLTLSNAGRLAGTPSAAGSYGFTVTATDANGNAGAQAYSIAIAQAAQTISFANPGAKSLSDSPAALTATASSGLPVSFVSTTTGICTVSGSSVTLLRTGTCTIEARQEGNADVAAATPVTQSFAVTAARLAASQAQASVTGQVGVALSPVVPVTIAGGTAPYAYTLTGGTLPAGLAFSADTGTLSGTPTGGQDATAYTVTVRDAGGQTASAGFTLAVAAPTLAIGQTTLPDGAFQAAYSQQLTATGGTQPYRFAVTTGALPAGLTLSPGGLVSGTPTAFGRFPLTVTVTDSSTGTGPYSAVQGYTLLIAAPTIPTAGNAAATVAYGSSDNVVTPPLTGEVTALAVATQPTHGTARVDGRTLVYTPAAGYAGPDSFTYTASNAGGTSTPGTVSVTVSAPAVTITPASLPDGRQGDAYSQQLTAAGGTAPYAFTVASGTLPAGLTLSPTGLVSGTPSASGSATFTVRATDSSTGAGPFSATQSYTLAVALPAAPTVRPVPTINAPGSSTAANTPTTIVLSDYVSGNFTSIVVVTAPQNGTVTLSTTGTQTIATYTPRTNFSGTDGFTFAAVGPGGRSPVSSIALSITGTAPVVRALTASAVQGTPVTVDLTAAATGGPFTAAAVTGVSPAGSVQTAIVEGGSAGARTYSLVLTPSLAFSGTATVTYTLSNQFGASAPASVTLSVAARPDPSRDANVNGLSAAQAEATRRFARSQTDNFFRRNEQLHNGGNGTGGRDMGVGFQVAELGGLVQSTVGNGLAPDADDLMRLKSEHAQAVLGAELASGAVTMSRGGMNGVAGLRGRQVLQQGTGVTAGTATGTRAEFGQATGEGVGGDVAGSNAGERRVGSIGIWSGGAVTVGAWDKDADRAKLTLTTSGLSAGADIKLADNLIVGAGGGYGADLTRIGGDAARVRGRSWSVAGYGSWAPTEGLFVDGIFGGGSLDFDTRRRITQTGASATGSRDGSMLFGSVAAGFDRRGAVDLSAYGRVDWLSARLDRYTESGGGIYGLTYGRRDLDSVASVLGLRVGYPQPGWTPRVRGEWRHEFADSDAQLIDYADVANLRYATRGDFWIRDAFTIDVGVEFGLGRGWGVAVDVGASGGSGATAGTARLGVRKEF